VDPFLFSDSLNLLPNQNITKALLDAHPAAYSNQDFTSAVTSANTCVLNFAIFEYPNANNSGTPPIPPLVEILDQNANFDDPGHLLQQTGGGTGALTISTLGGPKSVNYSYGPLGGGVFQISFTRDAVDLNSLPWTIRFTINDNATTLLAQKGLTFDVDSSDTRTPWLAVPGQLNLPPSGPPAIDFGTALQSITLSGPGAPGSARQVIAGKTYSLLVPVGNYGTGPLTVSGVNPAAQTNNFTMRLLNPLTVPPGSTDNANLQVSFAAPAAGQTGSAAQATTFALTCNDPLAAPSGATAHFNTVSLYATAGNFEVVLVLDLSGSMLTNDAGGASRWSALQTAVGQVMNSLLGFAGGANDRFGVVVYPDHTGNQSAEVVIAESQINLSNANALTTKLAGFNPVDSTPMAGTQASPGGVYTAAGHPGNPNTDCGIFLGSVDPAFGRNFRWVILMSDGMSNVGDDPKTIASAYFTSRRIGVISVAYGDPKGGQVDTATLKAIANESRGTNVSNPSNYFESQPTGTPSQELLSGFEKSVANALGLQFAVDPDAILAPGANENRHIVVITEYDQSASFLVCCGTIAEGELLQVQLLTPLGELVTPQNAATFEISFASTILSRSYFVSEAALINSKVRPRYGAWTIIVSRGEIIFSRPVPGLPVTPAAPAATVGTSASTEGALSYAYSVKTDSNLSLSVGSANPTTFAGSPISMVAALSLQGRPLSSAHLTAVIAGSGQGFDNWLASQTITQAEYDEALRSLEGLHDVQALFVKTTALARKGIFFPGTGSSAVQTLQFDRRTGTYRTTFPATTQPGTYQFLVAASGQDEKGNSFTRQQNWQTVVTPLPDAASTLVSISYQVVSGQMQASVWLSAQDEHSNVYLVDPQHSAGIQVRPSGGATASGPLKWNLDASYTQVFTYPLTATPTIEIVAGGASVAKMTPPDFGKMVFVNQVVGFTKGREATPGANKHVDPSKALGDPSRKPLTDFLALGGLGSAEFDIKGQVIHAKQVTVFVEFDADLRAYAVDVLPAQAGVGWIEIGRSRGVTENFSLVPKPRTLPDTRDWYIELEGRLAGETFDVKIPLSGLLKAPVDPLMRIGNKGIAQIRVRDLSNRVTPEPDRPGVGVQAIGFTP
jgi:hypothetical protein